MRSRGPGVERSGIRGREGVGGWLFVAPMLLVLVTFMLVLFCAWIWTLLGVASNSPGIYYLPAGRGFLIGYYLVLAIPALVVVPFMAFRSLAGEQSNGSSSGVRRIFPSRTSRSLTTLPVAWPRRSRVWISRLTVIRPLPPLRANSAATLPS